MPESLTPQYTITRSRRRTIAIHVHSGAVDVRAPMRAAQRDIDAFVKQKTPWILKMLAECRERDVEVFRVDDGCNINVMDETLTVRWQSARRGEVRHDGDQLFIRGGGLDNEKARRLFLRWLADQAEEKLLPMAEKCIVEMGLSPRLSGFTLRNTRTLWGRCSARGNILFNPQILLAPLPVIHYLIVHEAAHLRHMNHSREFWLLVASHCPDWQHSRRWLKDHGHRLQVK
ncbi:MAG TPA: SprT family zinc-dependent metalloprotease [Pseudomonadales bacterium]|nr:SprT family zinc-dependent metalloprotease [Pseudomonadales bacterium]